MKLSLDEDLEEANSMPPSSSPSQLPVPSSDLLVPSKIPAHEGELGIHPERSTNVPDSASENRVKPSSSGSETF